MASLIATSFSGAAVASPMRMARRQSAAPLMVSAIQQQRLTGKVVSTKTSKTATVEVVRTFPHPKYQKRIQSTKKYAVHDPEEVAKVGEMVDIVAISPMSKTKRFAIAK